jgi:hypothetical protein
MNARVGFRFGEMSYVVQIADGALTVSRENVDGCDLILTGEPTMVAAVVYGGAPLDSLLLEGDRKLAARFISLFELPPKAG